MTTVYIVNSSLAYRLMFEEMGMQVVHSLKESIPDLVCFTGGEDVSPNLYGQPAHQYTSSNPYRDREETRLFQQFLEVNIPMVGICRGGQFLNIMNGGDMYQHVEGHTGSHFAVDHITGERVYVTSTHHQMMIAAEDGVVVLAADQNACKVYYGREKRKLPVFDTEAVFYPHTKCLCFQPHPEFHNQDVLRTYFFSLINRYLLT